MWCNVSDNVIARQSPEAQEIIRVLLAEIAGLRAELNDLRAQVEELRRQAKGKTPQNSSLPPSTQHPHAKAAGEEAEVEEATGRSAGPLRNTSGR